MNTLLLTGTVSPSKTILSQGYKSTSLSPEVRLQEYINTIIYYISNSDFFYIVFCENSNYKIPEKSIKTINETCTYYKKHFELLQFKGDENSILKKGYNYGEGECIDYAFENSVFLKKSKTWFKITGRYKYRNINDIIQEWKDEDYYFYRFSFPFLYGCVSEIFKCNNDIYEKYLYNIKEIVDFKKPSFLRSYEMMLYYKLKPILNQLPQLKSLPISHLMKQKGGGTNRNLKFQLFVNKLFLNKALLHRGGVLDFIYSIFWKPYCRIKLKLK